MKGLDANTQKYELAEIDHNVVLFTNMRLDRIRFRKEFFAMMSGIPMTLTVTWRK